MKKNRILLVFVAFATFFSACKDNTDTYVTQLYTNVEQEAAFRACLLSALDSAVSHLCVKDGYYLYNDGQYRLDFALVQHPVFDSLQSHQQGYLCDTLVLNTNRMAESCGSQIKSLFTSCIKSLEYSNHDDILYGDADAITNHFELYRRNNLMDSLRSPVAIRMNLYDVNTSWSAVMQEYLNYSQNPVNVDIQNYILNKMLDGIFEEMRKEEALIRSNYSHCVSADSILVRLGE